MSKARFLHANIELRHFVVCHRQLASSQDKSTASVSTSGSSDFLLKNVQAWLPTATLFISWAALYTSFGEAESSWVPGFVVRMSNAGLLRQNLKRRLLGERACCLLPCRKPSRSQVGSSGLQARFVVGTEKQDHVEECGRCPVLSWEATATTTLNGTEGLMLHQHFMGTGNDQSCAILYALSHS